MNLEERFWLKVDVLGKNDCWEWNACITKTTGYGKFSITKYKKIDSHRAVWILTHGKIKNNLWVLHRCDNKKCCNPNHLFLGTYLDNVADMVKKGRQAKGNKNGLRVHPESVQRGEKHTSSKLTKKQVLEIKQLVKDGKSDIEISSRYKVSPKAIYLLRHNTTYKEEWNSG